VNVRDYANNERSIAVNLALEDIDPAGFDAIYLPGSHPDAQTGDQHVLIARFAAHAVALGKPVFAVGDASLWLARANLLRTRHATGARTLQPVLVRLGVDVKDEPVVRDDLLYTSRDAFDLPRLMAAMTHVLAER
jgi:putative intracellular protease/amidase